MTRVPSPESSSFDERSPSPEPRIELIIIQMYVRRNNLSRANGLVNDSIDVNQSFEEVIDRLTEFAFDKLSLKSDLGKYNITFGSKWGTCATRIVPSNKKSIAPIDINLFADLKRESSFKAFVHTIRASLRGKKGLGNHILYLIALVTNVETSETDKVSCDEDILEMSNREVFQCRICTVLILDSNKFTAS
jgi:hypothetical protein